MSSATTDSLTWGLDPQQRAAVFSDAETLCLLAGAGAGKTRVLTRRVARRIVDETADAQHIMVLTFTRKAAGELKERLGELCVGEDVTVGTFHALAFAQLRRRWLDQGKAAPQVSSNPTRHVEAALERLKLERTLNARAIAIEIAWAKSRNLSPANYEEGARRLRHRGPTSPSQLAKVFVAYEAEKKRRGVIDYDDLLSLMTAALKSDATYAGAQRWKFRHFFVDEFQDLNHAQFELLQAWLGDRHDLFVVGDPNQAIYGWNGADASFLTEIGSKFPNVETLRLDTNYRSSPEVLRAATSVLADGYINGPEDHEPGGNPPLVLSHVDEVHEATGIARLLRRMHSDGYRWADMAILVRTNTQRDPLEKALKKYNIPFRSSGGVQWLREPEVRLALDVIRSSVGMRLAQCAADLTSQDEEPSASVKELIAAIRDCLADDPELSVVDFLAFIEIASRNDGPTSVAGVTVSTFHRAKGLEWPVVVLAGLEDGLVPFGGIDADQAEEERRLLYVALTRSQQRLILTWAQTRLQKDREPSPWLANIEKATLDSPALAMPRAVAADLIDDARAELVMAPPADADAKARINRWRTARAKLTGVEPRLILSDSVIDEIIDLNPATSDELATVEGFGVVRAASIGDEILTALHPD